MMNMFYVLNIDMINKTQKKKADMETDTEVIVIIVTHCMLATILRLRFLRGIVGI